AKACDGGCRALQGTQHGLFHAVEEVDWLDGLASGPSWAGQLVERSGAGGEVVERGQMSEIAPVASEQDVLQVPETVNGLMSGSDLCDGRAVSMFHLSVVLENGNVIGVRDQTQHASELVVHFYGGLTE